MQGTEWIFQEPLPRKQVWKGDSLWSKEHWVANCPVVRIFISTSHLKHAPPLARGKSNYRVKIEASTDQIPPVSLYSCWLNTETGFIWSFLGPVCTIIMVSKLRGAVCSGAKARVLKDQEVPGPVAEPRPLISLKCSPFWPSILEISKLECNFFDLWFFYANMQMFLGRTTVLSVPCASVRKKGLSISSEYQCWMREQVERN